MGLHIVHFSVETLGQPGRKPGFGRGQIDAGHADLGKSAITGPPGHLCHQLRTVDLTAAERHPPIVETQLRRWASEEETCAFARRLAAHPAIADCFIELHGDLGAGKTTLVRHILRALGVQGRIKSPTYAVVEPYEVTVRPEPVEGAPAQEWELSVWHFDFYRFSDPREWEDAGFRDLFSSPGLKLAEWPEKAAALLPRADLVVRLEVRQDDSRDVTLIAQTMVGRKLLR